MLLAAVDDGERLAVDARLDEAVDGVEEIVAVELRVEAQDAAAEQAVAAARRATDRSRTPRGSATGCART